MFRKHCALLFVVGSLLIAAPLAQAQYHSADYISDWKIDLSELLRFIQFFNSEGLHCAAEGEVSDEGFATGPGDQSCSPHDGDYNEQDWTINLSELLRIIQFFNSEGYEVCESGSPGEENGFCALTAAPEEVTLTTEVEGNTGEVTITMTPSNGEGLAPGHFFQGANVSVQASYDVTEDQFLYWLFNGVQYPSNPIATPLNLQNDATITAVFASVSIVTLTTGVRGNSGTASVTVTPSSSAGLSQGQYFTGEQVLIAPQYDAETDLFKGWTLNDEDYGATNPLTYFVSMDTTLIAEFQDASAYTVETSVSGNLLPVEIILSPENSEGLPSGQYYSGEEITCSLSYNESVESFSGWTVDDSTYGTANQINFAVASNHSIEANFGCDGGSQRVDLIINDVTGEPGATSNNTIELSSYCVLPTDLDFSFSFNYLELEADIEDVIPGTSVNTETHNFSVEETDLAQLRVRITAKDPDAGLDVNAIPPGPIAMLAATISPDAEYCDELRIDPDFFHAYQGSTALVDNPYPGIVRVVSTSSLAPEASFDATPVRGLTGMEVQFVDTTAPGYNTSTDSCENLAWAWNFGDGGTSSETDPAYTYDTPGIYSVTLSVTNSVGTDVAEAVNLIQVIEGVTVYVDKDSVDPLEGEEGESGLNGEEWATAFHTIQEGIDAAYDAGGGEVWVASGTYSELRNVPDQDRGSLVMREVVHIYGGFDGTEATREERDYVNNATIIDGSKARNWEPAYHVILGSDSSVVDGFTIEGGSATGTISSRDRFGGALYNYNVTMTVRNCTFQSNSSNAQGGAIYNSGSNLFLDNCQFLGNSVEDGTDPGVKCEVKGGAIANSYSILTLQNCSFVENQVISYTSWDETASNVDSLALGGAISNNNGSLVAVDCDFANNESEANGVGAGPIGNEGDYYAARPFALGSAIYSKFGLIDLDRCIIQDNEATTNPNGLNTTASGALYIEKASLVMTNSLVVENTVEDSAGGARSGGIHIDNTDSAKDVLIVNCTIAQNSAVGAGTGHGGGLSAFSATPFIINSIIYYNSGDNLYTALGLPTVANSNVQGGEFLENDSISTNPAFVDPSQSDYSLSEGSPCIDTGRDTSSEDYGSVIYDIEQRLRGVAGSNYDMGAYEYYPAP